MIDRAAPDPAAFVGLRLREDILQVGDVILTTTRHSISRAIRTATASDISHAMIYVDHCSVIDATGEGVHARNSQRFLSEPGCAVHVLRLRQPPSQEALQSVINHARAAIGTEYDMVDAVRSVLGGNRRPSAKQFCSRLVAQAFAAGGIRLVPDPNFCSPEDLRSSPLLTEISDATRTARPEEAAFWGAHDDATAKMRAATNELLETARRYDNAIQTIDDIGNLIIGRPDLDAPLCDALARSGYLDLWREDISRNPDHYDIDRVVPTEGAAFESYCWGALAEPLSGPHRFIVNRGGYNYLWRLHRLRFFELLSDLHERLAWLRHQRLEVAAEWLVQAGKLEPMPAMEPLRPHSPEWFATLEIWDPAQAMMTRSTIAAMGSENVCSVCGDDPAADYRLLGHKPAAGSAGSLRLCDDCFAIRRNLMREPYVAWSDPAAG